MPSSKSATLSSRVAEASKSATLSSRVAEASKGATLSSRVAEASKSATLSSGVVAALAALLLLAGAAPAGAATAGADAAAAPPQSGRIGVDYRFYVGGLNFLALHVAADLAPGRYTLATRAQTQGIADTLAPFSGVSRAEGAIEGGRPRPSLYTASSDSIFGKRRIRMDYAAAGPPKVEAEPPDEDDDRDPVPEKLRAGTVDPLSAGLVSALAQSAIAARDGAVDAPLSCPASVPVYDGRRRYDLVFTAAGEEILKTSHEAAYGGPAIVCRMEVKRLAGFSHRWLREEQRKPSPPSRIWLARLGPERVVLPVRLESRTQWGAAIAHLERLRADSHTILEIPGLEIPDPDAPGLHAPGG